MISELSSIIISQLFILIYILTLLYQPNILWHSSERRSIQFCNFPRSLPRVIFSILVFTTFGTLQKIAFSFHCYPGFFLSDQAIQVGKFTSAKAVVSFLFVSF